MTSPSDRPAWPFERLCLLGLAFLSFVGVSLTLLLPIPIEHGIIGSWRNVMASIVIGVVAVAMLIRRPS